MRNLEDEDDNYDYSPNELAELARKNPNLYANIVNSNLNDGDTIEKWQSRNTEYAKECLEHQRRNRK
jgi:hypothetical protein